MDKLLPCPFCGGPVAFHQDPEECSSGCHYIHCPGCEAMVDLAIKADPKNEAETLDELKARIVPLWNRRAHSAGESHGK